MKKDAPGFAKSRYFDGYSDNHLVQEIFDLISSFIQESADKHIPSKTNSLTSIFCSLDNPYDKKINS